MYTSLDKVDIVTTDSATGEKRGVQTDHRTAEEIAAEPELSVVFALTRISNCRRIDPPVRATYVCNDRPPDFLREAVSAAGGDLANMLNEPIPYDGTARPVADLADEAFRRLGERVAGRLESPVSAETLAELERLVSDGPTQEEDEISYWTSVVELCALAGEVVRAGYGGRWIDAEGELADILPFAFQTGDGAKVNLTHRARRSVAHGPAEGFTRLLAALQDSQQDKGPLLLTLKPADWARPDTVGRPLLSNMPDTRIPFIAYGHDLPNAFSYLAPGKHDLDALHAEAVRNLGKIEVEIEEVELGSFSMLAVSGDFYAAEKLLDVEFMKGLQARLGTPLLAASVPRKALLFVVNGVLPPEDMGKFMTLCERTFEKEEAHPVSPLVFGLNEGVVCALVTVGADEPPKRKGFFGRLFGRRDH